ncbi:MAG: hypothetical protein NVSMB9_27540 [Isosphaeraceae bacterium]
MDKVYRPSRCRTRNKPSIEGLEDRRLMSTALPDIVMVSARTVDSRGLTIEYDVKNAPIDRPVHFGVYRSADDRFDAKDVPVGSLTIVPPSLPGATVDENGNPATSVGHHKLTAPLPGGLSINPKHPFVLVVADPGHEVREPFAPDSTASFRKHVIGVITHGGVQPKNWSSLGPPWERRMTSGLLADGYDTVIPYNWVGVSGHAGSAARQAPILASMVHDASQQFPPNDPVDVHFIGHSEGAVVNSEALLRLNKGEGSTPALKAGSIKVTMLDPHAATSAFSGQQYSVQHGPLGWLARQQINSYQSRARDPLPVVPSNVQEAEVFYQHTPVSKTHGSNNGIYNLWGQVPVRGAAHYYNLTATGVSHGGKFGVQDWYRLNVVPELGDGAPRIRGDALSGTQVVGQTTWGGSPPTSGVRHAVSYTGTSAPRSRVRLLAAQAGQDMTVVGHAVTGPDGTWHMTTRPLTPGRYRVVAVAQDRPIRGQHRLTMQPTAWLAPMNV